MSLFNESTQGDGSTSDLRDKLERINDRTTFPSPVTSRIGFSIVARMFRHITTPRGAST